jgi:cytochrome c556
MIRARRIAGVAVTMTLAVTVTSTSFADDRDVIEYREHIMNTLNEQTAIIGLILSTSIPDDNAVAHLETIALTASTALAAFVPKVPGGEAKVDVWSSWPDFSKRMNDFARRTQQAAKLARDHGKEQALTDILDALTCKSCHEIYRAEKRK